MNWDQFLLWFVPAFVFFFPQAQSNPSTQSGCPVEILHFNPDGVSARVKNISGKEIDGLVFNIALSDATEHFKWLHWNFDPQREIENFNWNRQFKAGASKTMGWDSVNLDFNHGGGGAFVLTSALFADGTEWEAPADAAPCKFVWYNNHKKVFLRPIELPPR